MCSPGGAAYALLLSRSHTEPFAGWLTRLHQVAYAAYEQLPPGRGQRQAPRQPARQPRAATSRSAGSPPYTRYSNGSQAGEYGHLPDRPGFCHAFNTVTSAPASMGNWSRWRFRKANSSAKTTCSRRSIRVRFRCNSPRQRGKWPKTRPAQERQGRSRTLQNPAGTRLCLQTATRHPDRHGDPVSRASSRAIRRRSTMPSCN